MLVQVNTDNHVDGTEELTRLVEAEVAGAVGRFGDQITRVEVHVNDVNGPKSGGDKRCMMEARISGHQPVAVTHVADSIPEAVTGAAEKLERSLDRTLGRLSDHKGRTSMGGDQTI